jgi:hypothetical protein
MIYLTTTELLLRGALFVYIKKALNIEGGYVVWSIRD